MQQYRQLAAAYITYNHHKFTKNMQNIVKVKGEFRIHPKALEKHQYQVVTPNKIV